MFWLGSMWVRWTEMKKKDKVDWKNSVGGAWEDNDEDEMVKEGAENSHLAFTCHQYNKPNQPHPKFLMKQWLPKYNMSYQKFPWLHVRGGL